MLADFTSDGTSLLISGSEVVDQDFSGRRETRWVIIESHFERCRFDSLKVPSFSFGSGMKMSEYVDCTFDGSTIGATAPGRARFIRCSFRNVRLSKWFCTNVEMIDCTFSGTLKEINFVASLNETDQAELGRSRNEYLRNDFSAAKLAWVSFQGGVDLLDQRLPSEDGYVLLTEPEPVLSKALEQIDTWQESEDREEARSYLAVLLKKAVRGQRQLLLSPHDWTSRSGEKERIYRRLTDVIASVS
ncbi:hypothetical protein ACWEIJ_42905 [Lentzea sp. NPDC004789]